MGSFASHPGRRHAVHRTASFAVAAALAVSGALANGSPAGAAAGAAPAPGIVAMAPSRDVCAAPTASHMRCFSKVLVGAGGWPLGFALPAGYGPADLQAAYALPGADHGSGQTVAVVDAYDDPNAEADLAVYRGTFGLPACTTKNGCFRKIDQNGGIAYPPPSRSWAEEISLDVDMVSAVCPNCHILLVEATTNSAANLFAAEKRAVAEGATEISNSWGGPEYGAENADDDAVFDHPGIAITASSGDTGYGVSFPAASRYVTAVGGTTLTESGGVWTETAWRGAGSGCSVYVPKPAWQSNRRCGRRTVADVSAVADPNSGVAVYDTYELDGTWFVFGGTSASAPIIASAYALAGGQVTYGSTPYAHASALHDVIGGSNGSCPKRKRYLCRAVAGYDGPTGLGTPNGLGAF